MELASDTKQLKYSPTSTPILDLLRPLPRRRWIRLNAGEYFFLSGAVILGLIGLPALRNVTELLGGLGHWPSIFIACVLIPGGGLLFSLGTHEAAHLIAAWLVGFRRVGTAPGDKGVDGSEWACDVVRAASLSLEPRKMDHIRRRLFLLFAAGPTVNLVLPAALEVLAWGGSWSGPARLMVHIFAGISVLHGIADLLPDTGRGNFSDGSRLLMLLRNDALGQRWLLTIELLLSVRAGAHPSASDEPRVLSLTAIRDETGDAVAARYLVYQWAGTRQDITTATRYLEDALEISYAATPQLCDRLFLEAAFFQAWFREDVGKARFWAALMRRPSNDPMQKARLAIAQLWADEKLFDAWEKLCEHLASLQELPPSPARDLAQRQALDWKPQMESRMLTRAWRTIYAMSQEVEKSAPEGAPAEV